MALFFNIETLERLSCNDPMKFLALLEMHWKKITIPSRKYKYTPASVPLHGSSFILNPHALFISNVDPLFKVQFIKLAAKRDYALYKLHGYKDLQLSYFPDLLIDVIKQNPLLEVTKTEIKFKQER